MLINQNNKHNINNNNNNDDEKDDNDKIYNDNNRNTKHYDNRSTNQNEQITPTKKKERKKNRFSRPPPQLGQTSEEKFGKKVMSHDTHTGIEVSLIALFASFSIAAAGNFNCNFVPHVGQLEAVVSFECVA